jgi:hypothetical protein
MAPSDDLRWLIELEVDYQLWRKLVKAKVDDRVERERWVKMCHRIGSSMAREIVVERKRKHMA